MIKISFLGWITNETSDILKNILIEREVSDFSKEDLRGIPKHSIKDFVEECNEAVRNIREEYIHFLDKNQGYNDNQEGFENWYDIRNGLRQTFDSDEENYECNDRYDNKVLEIDEKCNQTYSEFLERTGIEDTEQNYQKFIFGYSEADF